MNKTMKFKGVVVRVVLLMVLELLFLIWSDCSVIGHEIEGTVLGAGIYEFIISIHLYALIPLPVLFLILPKKPILSHFQNLQYLAVILFLIFGSYRVLSFLYANPEKNFNANPCIYRYNKKAFEVFKESHQKDSNSINILQFYTFDNDSLLNTYFLYQLEELGDSVLIAKLSITDDEPKIMYIKKKIQDAVDYHKETKLIIRHSLID